MSGRPSAEERRAPCAWEARGIPGVPASGEGEAVVTDDGLSVGPVAVEHLDLDGLAVEGRTIVLTVWPEGVLRISQLARRHDTFVAALRGARDEARVAGLLAHGIEAPRRFAGAVRRGERRLEANLLLWPTHLTVVPVEGDPFQLPLGDVGALRLDPGAHEVVVPTGDGAWAFGQLARLTDDFHRALAAARDAGLALLAAATGSTAFADGRAVAARDLPGFENVLAAVTAPEREANAAAILARAPRGETRLGLVTLLDPDSEGLAAKVPLPPNVAAFLLAPLGERVVLELLSGPSAATYLFRGGLDSVARDLMALHFRRRPLALTAAEAAGPAGRPYRLALRRLEPLRRLRSATLARVIHDERWALPA